MQSLLDKFVLQHTCDSCGAAAVYNCVVALRRDAKSHNKARASSLSLPVLHMQLWRPHATQHGPLFGTLTQWVWRLLSGNVTMRAHTKWHTVHQDLTRQWWHKSRQSTASNPRRSKMCALVLIASHATPATGHFVVVVPEDKHHGLVVCNDVNFAHRWCSTRKRARWLWPGFHLVQACTFRARA